MITVVKIETTDEERKILHKKIYGEKGHASRQDVQDICQKAVRKKIEGSSDMPVAVPVSLPESETAETTDDEFGQETRTAALDAMFAKGLKLLYKRLEATRSAMRANNTHYLEKELPQTIAILETVMCSVHVKGKRQ